MWLQGQLSLRLLAASRVATREAGLEHLLDAIPKQVEAGEMLLVMIHRKVCAASAAAVDPFTA